MGLFDGVMDFISGGKDSAASGAMQAAVDAFSGIESPNIEDQKIAIEQLVQQGKLTPEQAEVILQQGTELSSVSTDPRLKQAQLAALSKLEEVGNQGGLSFEDRSRLNHIQSELNRNEQANRQAIMQNMASRGMGGSGFELAAQLANQQGAAERASTAGLDVKAQAERRALEALMGAGQLGGQIRGQEFDEKARAAQAQDSINQFNAANRQSVQNANVDRRNVAQQANLQERQRVADSNVELRNKQQQYNKELQQQKFQNQMTVAGGKSGALSNQANMFNEQAGQRRQFLGDVVSAGAQYAASDKRLKEDVRSGEVDIEAFLDSLTGYSYKYKNPKFGQGKQVGVMAQDLEQTPVGKQAVEDTAEGKMVDYGKLQAAQMAALANLNERLRKIEDEDGQ